MACKPSENKQPYLSSRAWVSPEAQADVESAKDLAVTNPVPAFTCCVLLGGMQPSARL